MAIYMIEQDTIRLLRECDSGAKMGVQSIDDVMDYVHDDRLRRSLDDCRRAHAALGEEIRDRLDRFGDEGKDPNPIAKGMSWLKSKGMLAVNGSDSTVADLMTDGCGMGVKSLSRYLNEYEAAEEYAKDIAKRLIRLEDALMTDVRAYL